MSLPWQVGVVGAGSIADNVHLPVLLAQADVNVAWVTDLSLERSRVLADSFRVDARPSTTQFDIDILLVAIPLVGREEWLGRCAAAGVAALVEKPFARSLAEHDRLAALLPAGRMAVCYQRRFHATTRFIAASVKEGWFGRLEKITHGEGGRVTRGGPEGYADLPVAEGGGLTLNLGCHALDLACYVTSATQAHVVDRSILWDGAVDRGASARIALTTTGGEVDFNFCVSDLERQPNRTEYAFEHATLTVSTAPGSNLTLARAGGQSVSIEVSGGAIDPYQAVYSEWRDLMDAMADERIPVGSPSSSRLTTQLIEELVA